MNWNKTWRNDCLLEFVPKTAPRRFLRSFYVDICIKISSQNFQRSSTSLQAKNYSQLPQNQPNNIRKPKELKIHVENVCLVGFLPKTEPKQVQKLCQIWAK